LTLGKTVDEAIHLFVALENACRVQLLAEAAAANGIPKRIIDEQDAAFTAATLQDPDTSYVHTSHVYGSVPDIYQLQLHVIHARVQFAQRGNKRCIFALKRFALIVTSISKVP